MKRSDARRKVGIVRWMNPWHQWPPPCPSYILALCDDHLQMRTPSMPGHAPSRMLRVEGGQTRSPRDSESEFQVPTTDGRAQRVCRRASMGWLRSRDQSLWKFADAWRFSQQATTDLFAGALLIIPFVRTVSCFRMPLKFHFVETDPNQPGKGATSLYSSKTRSERGVSRLTNWRGRRKEATLV